MYCRARTVDLSMDINAKTCGAGAVNSKINLGDRVKVVVHIAMVRILDLVVTEWGRVPKLVLRSLFVLLKASTRCSGL